MLEEGHDIDVDMVEEMEPSARKRAISKEINFKYPLFRNENDVADDADKWMGDLDRKILGLAPKRNNIKQEVAFKVENKQ